MVFSGCLVVSYVTLLNCLYFEETQRHFEINVKVANAFGCHFISGTGNTVIEAVKVLIEHGVQPSVIILLSLFSTPHGEFMLWMVMGWLSVHLPSLST